MNWIIRPERSGDIATIHDLTKRAFAPMPFADGNEQDIIDRLRSMGDLTLSLVAEQNGAVAGHAAFSQAACADSVGWYGLGPLSVEPALQRKGIGKALIAEGLRQLQEMNARGCIVMGDTNYYPRSGFKPCPELAPANEPAQYFMVLPFTTAMPAARFSFHPAFYGS
jgi:putative acetyltransferase